MADMDEAVLKRVLPHSIEAEQSVRGAMLVMDRKAITVPVSRLTAKISMGNSMESSLIPMVEPNDEGKPVDLITLQDLLKGKEQFT